MSNSSLRYVLSDTTRIKDVKERGIMLLGKSDSFLFVKGISDILNAERNGADAVIWNSDNYDLLEELSPKERSYGWMLVSLNIPIYIYLSNLGQLDLLENIHFDGFYADDLDLLIRSKKKMESLSL
jgi:hypothetical protein